MTADRELGQPACPSPPARPTPVWLAAAARALAECPADPAGTAGSTAEAVWYTEYGHIDNAMVVEGQIVDPGAYIGDIAAHGSGAHLHFGLGDGQDLGTVFGTSPTSLISVCGQTQEVAEWLPVRYVGSRDGSAAGPAKTSAFSEAQLRWIRARTGAPVDAIEDWYAQLGSPRHSGYEYYTLDLNMYGDTDIDEGMPVYNACIGTDVRTTCIMSRLIGDTYGIVLKHEKVGTSGSAGSSGSSGSGSGSGSSGSAGSFDSPYDYYFFYYYFFFIDGDDVTYYETDLVTQVCPIFTTIQNGSGTIDVVTGITVERRHTSLAMGSQLGAAFCETNPTDCCSPGGSGSGSSGSGGSGSSGGGGTVTVPCCSNALPETLRATFSGALAALGTVTLTWNAGASQWGATTSGCGYTQVRLECVGGVWQFGGLGIDPTDGVTPLSLSPSLHNPSATCDPLHLEFYGSATGTCSGPYAVIIEP